MQILQPLQNLLRIPWFLSFSGLQFRKWSSHSEVVSFQKCCSKTIRVTLTQAKGEMGVIWNTIEKHLAQTPACNILHVHVRTFSVNICRMGDLEVTFAWPRYNVFFQTWSYWNEAENTIREPVKRKVRRNSHCLCGSPGTSQYSHAPTSPEEHTPAPRPW